MAFARKVISASSPVLILEYGYGITPKNADIRHVSPDAAIQQLIDGNADAAVAAFGTDTKYKEWLIGGPLRKLEAAGRKINYVGVDKAAIDKVNKVWNTGFFTVTLPAGTLPLQEKPFMSGLNRGYMAANPDLPDDMAYALVKAVAKYGPEMAKLNALWKLWSTGDDVARSLGRQRASRRQESLCRVGLVGTAQEIPARGLRQEVSLLRLVWRGRAPERPQPSRQSAQNREVPSCHVRWP